MARSGRVLYEKGRLVVTTEQVVTPRETIGVSKIASAILERPWWAKWAIRLVSAVLLCLFVREAFRGRFWDAAAVFGKAGFTVVLAGAFLRRVQVKMKDGKIVTVGGFFDDQRAILSAINTLIADGNRVT